MDPLLTICAINDFYTFVPSDLDLWSLDLKFAPLVTVLPRYIFAKLEASTAFLFPKKSETHDGRKGATFIAASYIGGPRKTATNATFMLCIPKDIMV